MTIARYVQSALVATMLAACGDSSPWFLPRTDASTGDSQPPPDGGDDDVDANDGPPAMLELSGAIAPVHDPSIIRVEGIYYLFATGTGLPVHMSLDLVNWSLAGQVFATKPAWITTTEPGNPNSLWAPDVATFAGLHHLYYSASRFGSNTSCIGHATSLDATTWVDQGGPLVCSTASDNFNAIDPMFVLDEAGDPWLVFGSFWGGIQLIRLAPDGTRLGTEQYALATRANTAVEAPYIVHRDGYYYLFESIDFCCQGAASTYKIAVGRSLDIRGPYVDKLDEPLLNGGGTLLLEGDDRWKGPGHNAILHTTRDYNLYHSYDAQAGGIPTLRIAELAWGADGWPISAGP